MKSKLLLLACLIGALLTSSSQVKASHAAGGELNYFPINDSVYRVSFKLFRDCSGIPEPGFVTLCVKNPCDTIQNFTVQLLKLQPSNQNGAEIPYLCAYLRSTCNGGPFYGMEVWYYDSLVTLSSKCSNWTFSTTISARNTTDNINGGGNFYVEAVLDNLNFQRNTSPSFTSNPDPVSCALNTPYTFDHNGVEIDGDSLVYSLISARTAFSCEPFTNLNYVGQNTAQMPIPSSSFSLNTSTGQLSFNATSIGNFTVVVKCTEYRNGQVIGSIMREAIYKTANCSGVKPTISLDTNSLVNAQYINQVIVAYAESSFSFCFDGASTLPGGALFFNPDATTIPGAYFTFTGHFTPQASGCATWVPTVADIGYKVLRVSVKDTTCGPSNVTYPATTLIPIQILPARPIAVPKVLGNGNALVYPNPSNGLIQVDLATKATLTITTLDGREVGVYTISEKENIDLSSYANGLYILKIQDAQSGELMLSEKLVLRR